MTGSNELTVVTLPDPREIASFSDQRALECLLATQQALCRIQAVQVRAIARLSEIRNRDGSVPDEIGLELAISRHIAAQRVDLADVLLSRLPRTLAAMDAGHLDMYKASKVYEVTSPLSDEQCRELDARLAPRLAGKDSNQIRRAARDLVHRIDGAGANERAVKRREDRSVRLLHEEDAMATLIAYLPAETASAIYARVDTIVKRRKRGHDERTHDQLRADVLSELLLGVDQSDVLGTVFLHVPIGTALGITEHGAVLEGHGEIPGEIAREILNRPQRVWKKVITDPVSGAVLDVGRTTRRPPAAIRDLVRARDRECGMPHCHRPAHHAQLDHAQRWRHNGSTSARNIRALCQHHNLLREKTGWDVHHDSATGTTMIVTPAGHAFQHQPEPLAEATTVKQNDGFIG
ncbi:HNH endonuclease signature motif containing protein [Amycolatopsis alkalitolerans]|uniref:DUF222 domain-containing protein n=1 Tax=Amycolatopsis alkalitolerans TaxID=2547244 RepID=A0A5C4LVJ3_9PSEU|nr:HNH endonuclease signature motif containing protein [Amycolatopsis alkalitolerans]TNC21904.1 DUF222 domain-containing protein [Amycolatopsis alkalitolerans]